MSGSFYFRPNYGRWQVCDGMFSALTSKHVRQNAFPAMASNFSPAFDCLQGVVDNNFILHSSDGGHTCRRKR